MAQHGDWLAHNMAGIELSAIVDMAMRCARIGDVASLAWGVPSFSTPEHIREAAVRQLGADPNIGKYTLPDGLPELREAVARAHLAATGVRVDPDRHVLISAGNMQGLNCLLHTIIDPGDEVILTDPGFASHFHQVRLCGGRPVSWRLDEASDWSLDLDALPALVGSRTKAIVLVTPSNPTGKIFSATELRRVGELARAHGLLALLDDPYSHFTYENRARYFNLASVPQLGEHVGYLFTFSKCYAMTGWRVGYMVIPERLKREALKVHDATLICAPHVSQVAALAALDGDPAHLREFEQVLAARRDLICERLERVPHVFAYTRPEGAYYVFPKIVAPHRSSAEFATWLLETAGVGVTPGSAFGLSGEHRVRMAFCVSEDTINLAFDRIEAHIPA